VIQVIPKPLIFEEYLAYDDGTDNRYELINGALVAMPQPTGQHADIAEFLNDEFRSQIKQQGLPLVSKQQAIALQLPPTEGRDSGRIPDICVVTNTSRLARLFPKSGQEKWLSPLKRRNVKIMPSFLTERYWCSNR